jgi:hypothetical protein
LEAITVAGLATPPTNDEDCFAVESDDGTNKIFVRALLP